MVKREVHGRREGNRIHFPVRVHPHTFRRILKFYSKNQITFTRTVEILIQKGLEAARVPTHLST